MGHRTRRSAEYERASECNPGGNGIAPHRDTPRVEGAGSVDRKRIGTDNYGTRSLPFLALDVW